MKRKAQAAMEFLMSYGWAILVVISTISALAYMGVLDFSSFTGPRATLGGDFTVQDFGVFPSTFIGSWPASPEIHLTMISARDVIITNIYFESNSGSSVLCERSAAMTYHDSFTWPSTVITVTGNHNAVYPFEGYKMFSGSKKTFKIICGTSFADVGDKLEGNIFVEYKLESSNILHLQEGEIKNLLIN